MEESTIFDLLDSGLLHKWREAIEQVERETWVFKQEQEALKALEAELSEKSKNLLDSYVLALENRMDYLYYNLNIKVLNYGIKIGTELQKAFTESAESCSLLRPQGKA